MSKLWSEPPRAIGRGLLISLISTAIVLPLGCLLVLLPIAVGSHIQNERLSLLLTIVPPVFFVLLVGGGSWGFLWWMLRRRAATLDAAFNPLGLSGQREVLTMRRYEGHIRGRKARVSFRRGPTLELYLSTPLQTRFSVDEADKVGTTLAGWLGRAPLALSNPALEGLRVFAMDEAWARNLLETPQAAEALKRLLRFEGEFRLRRVELIPGYLVLRLHFSNKVLAFDVDVNAEQARQWFENLIALAEIAERLPAPQVSAQITPLEEALINRRPQIQRRIILITVGVLVGIPLCVALPIALAVILLGSGGP